MIKNKDETNETNEILAIVAESYFSVGSYWLKCPPRCTYTQVAGRGILDKNSLFLIAGHLCRTLCRP